MAKNRCGLKVRKNFPFYFNARLRRNLEENDLEKEQGKLDIRLMGNLVKN